MYRGGELVLRSDDIVREKICSPIALAVFHRGSDPTPALDAPILEITLQNSLCRCFIDSGSAVSIVALPTLNQFNLHPEIRQTNLTLKGVGGCLRPLGIATVNLSLANTTISHDFVVVENVNDIIGHLLLGWDLLERFDLCVRPIDNGLYIDNCFYPLLPRRSPHDRFTVASEQDKVNSNSIVPNYSTQVLKQHQNSSQEVRQAPVSEIQPLCSPDLATFFSLPDQSDECTNDDERHSPINTETNSPLTWHHGKANHASSANKITVPPHSSLLIKVNVNIHGRKLNNQNGHIFIEPSCTTHKCLALPPGVYQVRGGSAFIYVVNVANAPVKLRRGTKVSLVDFTSDKLEIMDLPYEATCGATSVFDPTESIDRALEEISKSCPDMSSQDKETLRQLFLKFPSILPSESRPIGRTALIQHSIDLMEGATPRRIAAYRVPHSKRVQLDKEIEGMLSAGIISPSRSPWSSPILLIPKSDGNFRVVADFRYVNSKTVKESFPMCDIKTLLLDINKKSKIFSSIDLKKGFLQVPLAESSKPITAFSTHSGHYEYNVAPMGLTNSPLTFCRLMSLVLQGLLSDHVLIYMDDILVTSETREDHVRRLAEIFQRLHDANLTINPTKCAFFATSLVFIGHTLTKDGILPNKLKVDAIQNFPKPASAKDVKSFIGLSGFYRAFVRNFSSIAAPLTSLLKKEAKFVWGQEQDQAFAKLKHYLSSPPVLAYPDYSMPFELYTDASNVGLGAVLMQNLNGKLKPIAYASRILSKAESSYCATDKEMSAIAWALLHFRDIILGYRVTVFMDHCPLTYMINSPVKDPFGKRARYFMTLSEYDVEVKYIKGCLNTPPDALSRAPINNGFNQPDGILDPFPPSFREVPSAAVIPVFPASTTDGLEYFDSIDMADIRQNLLADAKYGPILRALENNQSPPNTPGLPVDSFKAHNGILFRHVPSKRLRNNVTQELMQTVLPESYVDRFIARAHLDTLHAGKERTIFQLRKHFFFPRLHQRTSDYVKSCQTCELNKGSVGKLNPCGTYEAPSRPWETVFTDILTLPPSDKGSRYLIVFIDQGTRYCELAVLPNKTSKAIAKSLFDNVICRWGAMDNIISDNAPEFISSVINELANLLHIKHPPILSYRPQANAYSERLNRTIVQHIRTMSQDQQAIWCDLIPTLQGAINNNRHAAFSDSPDFANFGRDKRLPYDLLLKDKPIISYTNSTPAAIIKSQQLIWRATEKALRETVQKAKDTQMVKPKSKQNILGKRVYRIIERGEAIKKKLNNLFDGPYRVVDLLHNKAKCRNMETQMEYWFHIDKLKIASADK